jgi:hypothetical protein
LRRRHAVGARASRMADDRVRKAAPAEEPPPEAQQEFIWVSPAADR